MKISTIFYIVFYLCFVACVCGDIFCHKIDMFWVVLMIFWGVLFLSEKTDEKK